MRVVVGILSENKDDVMNAMLGPFQEPPAQCSRAPLSRTAADENERFVTPMENGFVLKDGSDFGEQALSRWMRERLVHRYKEASY